MSNPKAQELGGMFVGKTRTFAVTVQVDARIVVTAEFVENLRKAAHIEPIDPFLSAMNVKHFDDDEFVKAVLANGMRKMVRMSLVDNLHGAGVSATVAPAMVAYIEIPAVAEAIAKRHVLTEQAQQAAALAALAEPVTSDADVAALVADAPAVNPNPVV